MDTKCIDHTKCGKCSCCGECCGPFIPITYHEIKKIKKAIQEHGITYNPEDYVSDRGIEMQCPFLNTQTRRCKLHEINSNLKPEVCKRFRCNLSEDVIHKNKLYFDSRADVNGNSGKFMSLDLVFFDNPFMLLVYAVYILKHNTPEKLNQFLLNTGNKDIVDAINDGRIELEWSGE